MRQLVIEYVLEGRQRGYNFTSETRGFHDDVLKSIWRKAMPRGQGWGADVYRGARSLKTFALEDGRMALSDVIVTDQRDESGRGGIRRALVSVMQPGEYLEMLESWLSTYPAALLAERRSLPGGRGDKQTIYTRRYASPDDWQRVEVLILKHALKTGLGGFLRQGRIVPFTTLALDHREESTLVVLPADRARAIKDAHVIAL